MARPKFEHVTIVEGPLDEYDDEDLARVRAYKMMPPVGQVIAWLVWETPWQWYAIAQAGLLWVFYSSSLVWKLYFVAATFIAAFAHHARRRVPSPFRQFVVVARKIVPADQAQNSPSGPPTPA